MQTDSYSYCHTVFQSTLPARGSDLDECDVCMSDKLISIHAPRKGERREIGAPIYENIQFQSTLPARGSDANQD